MNKKPRLNRAEFGFKKGDILDIDGVKLVLDTTMSRASADSRRLSVLD